MKRKLIAVVVLLSVFLTACGGGKDNKNTSASKAKTKTKTAVATEDNSQYVSLVKDGEPDNYQGETYGEYFEKYFTNTFWKYKSNDGDNIVEFKGDCTYRDTTVTAKIEFLIDKDSNTFTLNKMTFNDVPQDQTEIDDFMAKIFKKSESVNNSSEKDKSNTSNSDNTKTENTDTSKDSSNSKNNSSNNKSTTETDDTIDKEKAVTLVKQYLKEKGDYMPKVIEVDSEDDKNFNVHCYDVVDSGKKTEHTATSGWYYVNKKTGKVTSMF